MAMFRNDLGCEVSNLEYDFDTKKGKLTMESGQCCDLSGCISIFEKIDQNVEIIETFSGDKSDTIFKRVNGDWQSVLTR